MNLYNKLLDRGGRLSSYQATAEYSIIEYKGISFGFLIQEEEDFEGYIETHYTLKDVIMNGGSNTAMQRSYLFSSPAPSAKKYDVINHVVVYNNAILLREAGIRDQDTQIFLQGMGRKYFLDEEDIKEFEQEGFKLLITL